MISHNRPEQQQRYCQIHTNATSHTDFMWVWLNSVAVEGFCTTGLKVGVEIPIRLEVSAKISVALLPFSKTAVKNTKAMCHRWEEGLG